MPVVKEQFQLGKTINGICYFIIFTHVIFIILLNITLDFFLVGEPAEIHQRRVSGPSREQE